MVALGTAELLAPHHDVVGIAYSATGLFELLAGVTTDCVLLDISMPDRNGLEILPELRTRYPGVKVVMLTMHVDREFAGSTISLGAHGYVTKECGREVLLAAIAGVMAGRTFISPDVPRHTRRAPLKAPHLSVAALTPRQHEILDLLGQGKSTRAIAQALHLSDRTVEFHRARLRKALGIANEWGLVRHAVLLKAGMPERKRDGPG